MQCRPGAGPGAFKFCGQRVRRLVDLRDSRLLGVVEDHPVCVVAIAIDRRKQGFTRAPEFLPDAGLCRRDGFGVIGVDAFDDGVELPFENEVSGLQPVSFERRGRLLYGTRTNLFDQLEKFGKAHDDQRHRVVAVEIRVENQVRLVAEADDQRSRRLDRQRTKCRFPCIDPLRQLRDEFAAVHAFAKVEFGVAQLVAVVGLGPALRRE